MSRPSPSGWSERKRRQNAEALAPLLEAVTEGEAVRAVGKATYAPIVITDRRVIRAGHRSVVSIPFERVMRVEHWTHHTHRWSVRLIHEPIDPRPPPSDAHQWWRFHDRWKYRREVARRWRETVFHFSGERTEAADAMREELARANVPFDELETGPHRRPRRVPLRRID